MYTRLLMGFFCLIFSHLSAGKDESKILDYGLKPFIDPFNQPSNNTWRAAFNSAPELAPFFIQLKNDLHIDTAIETGTWETGSTTKFLSMVYDEVATIEVDRKIYQKAVANLANFPNIKCYRGSSEIVLSQILPMYVNKPIVFYLDAHWYEKWPLLDELEAISATHRDNCIIVIDDFKVPGRADIPYDSYGDQECSYKYIKKKLKMVFSEYDSYYLLPAFTGSKAKFVALPKKWNFRPQN